MVGLAGCAGGSDGDGGTDGSDGGDEQLYGILSTAITDQPNDIGDFEQLNVTLDGIWAKPAGGDESEDEDETESGGDEETPEDGTETPEDSTETKSEDDSETTESGGDSEMTESEEDEDDEAEEDEADDEGSGRYYIEFEEPQRADLVQLQGAETALVDETEVEVGEYQFLQLDVSDATGILAETGEEADVETPGNAPLKFDASFEIRAEERTRFIADFAPHGTGQGKYVIRPVTTGTQVLYGDEEYEPDEDAESTDDGTADQTGGDVGDGGVNDGDGGDGGADGDDGFDGADGGADGADGGDDSTTATETTD